MAYGIDAEAHSACLDAGGNTIAVLAGGVDIPYPAANRSLYERILDNDGLILSEAPPGTRARRDMFVKRNRIVTGLAQALVIIEAEMSSGSLTSARFAAEQGKDLFCPPGPVYAPTCQGTHYLLKNGAVLITEADDILSWLGWESHPGLDIRPFPSSSDPILTTLAYGPLHADTLAARTGMDMSELMGKVSLLELEGSITRNTRGEYEAI
jgi:DNA processing protein